MDADGAQVIGHGHYEVSPGSNDYATTLGEDRFDNGEYDLERDKLELRGGDQVPRMVTFEYTFFNVDGTLQRVGKANFQTGLACCTQYENGQPVVHSAVLQFPSDRFAGSAIVLISESRSVYILSHGQKLAGENQSYSSQDSGMGSNRAELQHWRVDLERRRSNASAAAAPPRDVARRRTQDRSDRAVVRRVADFLRFAISRGGADDGRPPKMPVNRLDELKPIFT